MPRQREDSDENIPEAEALPDIDDEPVRKKRKKKGTASGGLVPYKNPAALVGYYVGVFALLPVACFIVGMLRLQEHYGKVLVIIWVLGNPLAPAAFLLGLFGLRSAKVNPKAKGMGHAISGLVLGSLALVANLICVVVLLVVTLGDKK